MYTQALYTNLVYSITVHYTQTHYYHKAKPKATCVCTTAFHSYGQETTETLRGATFLALHIWCILYVWTWPPSGVATLPP